MALDTSRIRRRVLAVLPDRAVVNITPALSGLSREDAQGELAQRLTLKADADAEVRGRGPLGKVLALGVRVIERVSLDGGASEVEVFRGPIWDRTRSGEGELEATCYDELIYLAKSEDARFYPAGQRGADVLADIFTAWQVPVGRIDGPTAQMPKLALQGTLADMVLQVLQHALATGDKAYWVRMVEGRVDVAVPGGNTPVYVLDERRSVSEASDRESLDDVRTEVRVLGADAEGSDQQRPKLEAVATSDSRADVGRLVAVLDGQQFDSPAKAREAARTELEKRGAPVVTSKRRAAAIPSLRKGDLVVVRALGLDGPVQVAGVSFDEDLDEMDLVVQKVGTPLYQAKRIEEQRVAAVTGGTAPVVVGSKRLALLAWAMAHLGTPYTWAGGHPGMIAGGWDCSGYVDHAYAAVGVPIGWDGTGGMEGNPQLVRVSSPLPGDIVLFPGHVGIVSEDTSQMYNASEPVVGTIVSSISRSAASHGGGPDYRRVAALDS
jgi:cell wall-associated NlpC family hydrolase